MTRVLLHGTPLTPAVWQDLRPALADQPLLTPDLTRVAHAADAQQKLATDVAAAIGDATEVDIVGHSFGGQVAIELALLLGERATSLTILCSRDTPFPPFASVAEDVRAGAAPTTDATLARWFTPAEVTQDSAAVRRARDALTTASGADWANALDAISAYDRADAIRMLAIPATLVAGGRDGVSTPAVMRAMAARMPDATVIEHEDWAHMSPFAHPERLREIIRAAVGRR